MKISKMEQDLEHLEEDMGSFTLEDAYENLKDTREELMNEIDELMHRTENNEFGTLTKCIGQDPIKDKHHKLMQGLLDNLHNQDPRILPLAKTTDLHKSIIQNLNDVVDHMQNIINRIKIDSEKTRKNIAYLKNKKAGLQKMMNACQGATENVGTHKTYRKEIAITKKLFNEVKADLYTCVDTIFPDNIGFKELLADFTHAYTRGGDDVYIDVTPENLEFIKFLIEVDIAVYHRNDRSKIKMTDLL